MTVDTVTGWDASSRGSAAGDRGLAVAEARTALEGDVLAVLPDRGVLAVRGADAVDFLQGQLTADVRMVDAVTSVTAAWCTAKGRVHALLQLLRDDDGFLAIGDAATLEETARRLRLFVLRSRVSIEVASDRIDLLGVAGTAAVERLREHIGNLPDRPGDVTRDGEVRVLREPGQHPRLTVIGPRPALARLRDSLAPGLSPVGPGAWRLLDVRAGVTPLAALPADEYLPQMLNLDRLGGISFGKGCYVGQEIVARTQYLGRLKRRLYRVGTHADPPPAPGEAVYSGAGESARSAGQIVVAAPLPGGVAEALAVLRIDEVGTGSLRLRHVLGPEVAVLPLPYPLEDGTPD